MIYDAVIVGGGLVGLAMAAALQRGSLKIALVESREPDLAPPAAWDTRVYAISPGSRKFLSEIGVWQYLDVSRTAPIVRMEVHGDAGGMIAFDAFDTGNSELALIVEDSALRRALWQAIAATATLGTFMPAQPRRLERGDDCARLLLENGEMIESRLLIGADGSDSWLRHAAGIASTTRPYAAEGLVANFRVEHSHRGIARQWFRGDSVLAWLPLPDQQISIVWATPSGRKLGALSPEELAQTVSAAGSNELGALTLVNKPALFPLQLLRVPAPIGERIALIGDAAHGVHPLAGQGVNLGFLDAAALAEQLNQATARPDCGHAGLLRHYARARKLDVLAMQLATHGLQKLFERPHSLLREVRNRGLDVTDSQGWLKALFVRHAFG